MANQYSGFFLQLPGIQIDTEHWVTYYTLYRRVLSIIYQVDSIPY